MADEEQNRNKTSGQRLVRVGGNRTGSDLYDNYGNEIKRPAVTESAAPDRSLPERPAKAAEPASNGSTRKAAPVRNSHAAQLKAESASEEQPKRSFQKRRESQKKQKKELLWIGLRVGVFVLCIALLAAVILMNGKSKKKINTQYIKRGSIDNAASGTLSFLRNEVPVSVSHSGTFVAYVNEGDRVSNGALIGYVVQEAYEAQLRQLRSVEEKITAAKQAQSYLNTAKSPELLALDDAIGSLEKELSSMAMQGNLASYAEKSAELSALYTERNDLQMNAETTDTYLQSLQKKRTSILNEISGSMHEVKASASGIISFCTDNREEAVSAIYGVLDARVGQTNFDVRSACSVGKEMLESVALPESELRDCAGASVNAGSVVARITPDISYYITMSVPSADGLALVPGKQVTVRTTSGNLSFNATACGAYYGPSSVLLVLRCESALMATVSERMTDGEIIFSHTEGLKVPLRALTEWDTAGVTARITIVRSGYVEYVYVNVLATDRDYAIVNAKSMLDDGAGISARENDEYVIEFEKVREGQAL